MTKSAPVCRVIVVLLISGSLGVSSGAQPRHPIYLQYDGFVRNPGASLTLSFGYYNLNQVDVTIAPGDDNLFLGSDPGRGQPTVFLAGRHRFACVMVVPDDFEENLRWQIRFGGLTSTTTDRLLDPLYALEAASALRVVEGVDPAAVPTGVCLDRDESSEQPARRGGR